MVLLWFDEEAIILRFDVEAIMETDFINNNVFT